MRPDREQAKKEENFEFGDSYDEEEEDDDWEQEQDWNNETEEAEGDIKDESAAYLEFLNEEVGHSFLRHLSTVLTSPRLKSSVASAMTMMMS
jgi:hypothetical protein